MQNKYSTAAPDSDSTLPTRSIEEPSNDIEQDDVEGEDDEDDEDDDDEEDDNADEVEE